MVALNFEHILVMLEDGGTIPRGTLHSQDGINLGDIHFCPILHTLHMQCISLDGLCTLLSEGTFAPPQSNMPPELSRTMAILLLFQVDSEHKRIINVYMGLVVDRVDSHLYSLSQVNNFIQDIDVDLREVHDALKARRDASKRRAYCLFVENLSSVMSIPMDPLYCLVCPTTYVKGAKPNHFDTQNTPVGTCLHHCVCQATLQFSNTDPQLCTKYAGSHLIIPHGAQYNDHLYPTIREPWNHRGPLIDPITGEPCPMEVVGDFKTADPIFKGSYRDSFLYSDDDLAQLRQQKVYLPIFQEEIPMPPIPSYRQNSEPAAAKQSPHRVAALDTSVESPKTKHSSSRSGPPQSTGHGSNTSTPKWPDTTSAKKPSHLQESTPNCPLKFLQACSSWKCSCLPSPAAESDGGKCRSLHGIDSAMVDTTLPIGSSTMDTFCSLTGSVSEVVGLLAPSITSTPLGKAGPREG